MAGWEWGEYFVLMRIRSVEYSARLTNQTLLVGILSRSMLVLSTFEVYLMVTTHLKMYSLYTQIYGHIFVVWADVYTHIF